MKAIVIEKYGAPDVLRLKEIGDPKPRKNEVLVRIQASSLNATDSVIMRGDFFLVRLRAGLFKPTIIPIPGGDISGIVEDVGKNVSQFHPGYEVFGTLSTNKFGGFAEYKSVNQKNLIMKPSNLTFEESAAVPLAGLTALHALRNAGKIQSGQKVLINGSSGGVGTFSIQLAKYFGAEVTAVCRTGKIDQALSLGADYVIDHTKEDFTRTGKKYDLILGIGGSYSIFDFRRAMSPNGRYVNIGGKKIFQSLLLGPVLSLFWKQKMTFVASIPNQTDLQFLKTLIETNKLKPVIDRSFPLNEVPEAIRYLEAGNAGGKIVINIGIER